MLLKEINVHSNQNLRPTTIKRTTKHQSSPNFKAGASALARPLADEVSSGIEFSPLLSDIFRGLLFIQQNGKLASQKAVGTTAEVAVDNYNRKLQKALDDAARRAEATSRGVVDFLDDILTIGTETLPYKAEQQGGRVYLTQPNTGVFFHNADLNNNAGNLPTPPLQKLNPKLHEYLLEHGLGGNEFTLGSGRRYQVSLIEQDSAIQSEGNPFNAIIPNGIRYEESQAIKRA